MRLIRHSTALVSWLIAVTVAAWLSDVLPAASQQADALFRITRDPRMISAQIKAAVPTFERGLALLTSSTDPEPTAAAVSLLHDTYRYLRAAQESSEYLERYSMFPDPLIRIRNQQILEIRESLLKCWGNKAYLAEDGPMRTTCIEGLEVGIRRLRVIVVTLP
jgi:hypothetical protein